MCTATHSEPLIPALDSLGDDLLATSPRQRRLALCATDHRIDCLRARGRRPLVVVNTFSGLPDFRRRGDGHP